MTGYKTICFVSIIGCLLAGIIASCGSRQATSDTGRVSVQKMTGFPDGEPGYSLGISACYAGLIDSQLLIAGGCNFPDIPAAEGGKKQFYSGIYIADITDDSAFVWRKVGELPMAAAYGLSVSTPKGIICVGGNNGERALSAVYCISLNEDMKSVRIDTLPSLPCTMDNMAGAVADHTLFVMGGNANGKPSNALICLDLDNLATGWQQLPAFPGPPRVQPVCIGQQKEGESLIYLWGGFAAPTGGQSATLSIDGYCYSPVSQRWEAVATPVGEDSVNISLGGGTGIAFTDSLILCMGGVNKDVFLSALQREEKLQAAIIADDQYEIHRLKMLGKEYMLWPAEQYRFNDRILIYNTRRDCWEEVLRHSGVARAGAALVGRDNTFFSINGELKPGIRTPEINKITINHSDN